ncbi:Dfp1/Him1, central region-domain-containing protein [Dactylonectria macrodidyma]|uniref:Dfp1/Him1, central region-domain-containing protein n=1 Tax=Dactylonectria macrodidyma TaxID=307937 RepID=A0A9P9FG65_9HYPO|nr:Dfp1/Him1, central region-domain-containing protein [Dactylonectria macrodidyma]
MSSRRGPLTNNPNVANSPLRGASTLAAYAKQKRSYATIQREEAYGQPPPLKKQVLDNGNQRALRSPTRPVRTQVLVQRGTTRPATKERSSRAISTSRSTHDAETEKEQWKKHHRAKFPKMVFYFESIPDDIRARLTKRVTYLGARQEPFFSIAVTHVVTTRSIPPERSETEVDQEPEQSHHEEHEPEEQPQTINPSLLDRNTEARRKLLFDFRNAPMRSHQLDDPTKRNKARNNDVLHKAREMGKKIWSLDKFQTMLSVLLEAETSHSTSYSSRSTSTRGHYGTSKGAHEPNLLQLLHNERLNGPSDRDPSAANRELCYFKGPHIYIWDMDEKQKPIMVREYPKVANKADGEWPQFRSVGNGRCPFVEEIEVPDKEHRRQREQEKARAAKREDSVPILKPPQIPVPKAVTGKRSLTEMEDGHNKARAVTPTEIFNPAKATLSKQAGQNAFTSRAGTGRLFAGEPVASGVQPSNITSAIRSQMISSTSGVNGAKAGTSKEVHGLQRKVLQKATPASHDVSSRRLAEVSMDVTSSRSTTMGRHTSRPVEVQDEENQKTAESKERKMQLKSKKDLKPGYCENCQDKFRDFDEHILSRKHRKFAENDDNWTELDSLLVQLKRLPKYTTESDEDDGW